uniref:Serine/arginine repetitive matrix protein 1-like isoform X3 n=1 Tax=Rhizophora mucronata TaxID=61149 RepID=A0A2P2LRY6_RHIMU
MNPVSDICTSFPFTSFPSRRPKIKLIRTSSSKPRSSVTRLAIHGLTTSIFTFLVSTRYSNSGANFCDLNSFACLFENRVS